MRRLHRGLLIALVVLLGGCGLGQPANDDAAASTAIRPPTLAVSTRALDASPSSADSLTVLVTTADGVDAPGFDAALAVLTAHPGIRVLAAAAGPVGAGGESETASGHPVTLVAAGLADLIPAAIEAFGARPDLVVVGMADEAALGSTIDVAPSVMVARTAEAAGLPALAVSAGNGRDTDVAAAGVMMRLLLDIDLDALLAPGVRLLNVPSCRAGIVRGPVDAAPAVSSAPTTTPDCHLPEPHSFDDDADAYRHGFATLVALPSSTAAAGQAIP